MLFQKSPSSPFASACLWLYWYAGLSASRRSAISRCRHSRNFSAAFEKNWYFFQAICNPTSSFGSSGLKHSGLPPDVLTILSRRDTEEDEDFDDYDDPFEEDHDNY